MSQGQGRILVVNYSGLGNAVLFKKSLARDGPEVHMLVEHPYLEGLLKGGRVRMVTTREKSFFFPAGKRGPLSGLSHFFSQVGFARGLKKPGYDASYVAYPNSTLSINLLTWLSGAGRRSIHRYSSHRRHMGHLNTRTIPVAENLHDTGQNERLLGDGGGGAGDLQVLPSFRRLSAALGDTGRVKNIGVIPGASPGWLWKAPGARTFAGIVNRRFAKDRVTVHIFGVKHEREVMDEVAELMRPKVRLLCDRPMDEVVSRLRKCDLVLAGDSGLMHVADLIGVPLIVFFGPTPVRTMPTGKKSQVVSRRSPCKSFCYYDRKMKERPFRCMYTGTEERLCLQGLEAGVRTGA